MKTLAFLLLFASSAYAQTIVKGTITLTATATDVTTAVGDLECGVAWVQFYLSQTPIGPQMPVNATGIYTLDFDTKTVSNGQSNFYAKAADKAGLDGACDGTAPNIAGTPALILDVQNLPPDVAAPTLTIGVK